MFNLLKIFEPLRSCLLRKYCQRSILLSRLIFIIFSFKIPFWHFSYLNCLFLLTKWKWLNWYFSCSQGSKVYSTRFLHASVNKLKYIDNQSVQLAHSTCMVIFTKTNIESLVYLSVIKTLLRILIFKESREKLTFGVSNIYYFRNLTFWDWSPTPLCAHYAQAHTADPNRHIYTWNYNLENITGSNDLEKEGRRNQTEWISLKLFLPKLFGLVYHDLAYPHDALLSMINYLWS